MAKAPIEGIALRELRTTSQACAQLGVTRYLLLKLCREGKLVRVRFGGQTRITVRSLNALVDEMLTNPRRRRG
jgi:excisionase family DNA binding protein